MLTTLSNVKALVGNFNLEKALVLVGAFSIIVKYDCETYGSSAALVGSMHYMSVRQLRLELQGDEAEAGVEELDLLHAEAHTRHVVVTAGRVVVPDSHHQALADQLAHGDPEGEGVVPDGVERLVLGGGLHVALLEPGVGVGCGPHPARALVQ